MSSPKIVILGSGIVGLTTAHHLSAKYPESKIVVLTKTTYSNNKSKPDPKKAFSTMAAAGIWLTFNIPPIEKTRRWALETLNVYRKQIKNGDVPGVAMYDGIHEHSGKFEDPWWADECKMKNAGPGIFDKRRCEFRTPIVDMDLYFQWLEGELNKRGVEIVVLDDELSGSIEKVCQMARKDYGADLLVNCTGMGARELCGDKDVIPGRGIILEVRPKAPLKRFHVNVDLNEREEITCVYPRGDVVSCGGTDNQGNWSNESSQNEINQLLDRCEKAVPEIKGAKIEKVYVGMRPYRKSGVRLDLERVDNFPVISNYGHGPIGVTTCWGSAFDVGSLVETLASKA